MADLDKDAASDPVALTEGQMAVLNKVAASKSYGKMAALRAQALLLMHAHPDYSNPQIAQMLGTNRRTVLRWRQEWRKWVSSPLVRQGEQPQNPIKLTKAQLDELLAVASNPLKYSEASLLRARILIAANEYPDFSNTQLARFLNTNYKTVQRWRKSWASTESIERISHTVSRAMSSLAKNLQLVPVVADKSAALQTLYQLYQYDLGVKLPPAGQYDFGKLTSDSYYNYLLMHDQQLMGFASLEQVNGTPQSPIATLCMAHLFVPLYVRRNGIATQAVEMLLDQHSGYWQIQYRPGLGVREFWSEFLKQFPLKLYQPNLTDTDGYQYLFLDNSPND